MAPPSWAKPGLDCEWLLQKAAEFGRIHVKCKAGQHSVEKATFMNETFEEYEKKFKGVSATWKLNDIGTGGTEEQRRSAIKSVSTSVDEPL